MKKVIALIICAALMLTLCACGKSEEVLAAEAAIESLGPDSGLEEIHAVYTKYVAVPFDDREKVENTDVLADYCDPLGGELVLTDAMLDEIKAKFEIGSLGFPDAEFAVMWYFGLFKDSKDWSDYSNVKFASHKLEDPYTYCGYGTVKIFDKYGNASTRELEVSYTAEYDEEEECGYSIESDVRIGN